MFVLPLPDSDDFALTHNILRLVAEIDEFKGRWEALANLAPERLLSLRRVATIESVASSNRIEGVQLSDREVENLLANLDIGSFRTRDEQEVAGYAAVMNLMTYGETTCFAKMPFL